MEQCIRAVRAWMVVDKLKLKLNEEKTEFMLIGTHQQLSKVRTDSLLVAGTVVSSVSEARNLDVWFDSNFQFQTHINKTCQSAYYYILQNPAARLLTKKPRYSHITLVMVDLHWLPVRFRIIFKVILFTFKAVHGTAPTYITNLLSFKQSRYTLRSVGNNTLARPEIKSAKTTGHRAFAVAAPLLWNALPPSLRAIDNITSFKKQLKTHLFRKAYF